VLFIVDLDEPRARSQAEDFDVQGWGSTAELLATPGIEIVVNLIMPWQAGCVLLLDAVLSLNGKCK